MKRKLQIFVSSTFTDLIDERQAAVAAILKAGHIPAGMELFTAADLSQMDTIKHWIDDSDVYMLILGGRYGSVEKSSGLSYTELEYDYARQSGKPTFAVVINEETLEAKVRSHGTDYIEKSNPKELALFRQKVLNNISSFFSDTKDIRLCVYESLSDFSTKPELKGWVYAGDVDDNKHLVAEINKLRDEKLALSEKISALEKSMTFAKPNEEADEELKRVLEAIDVKIPAKVTPNNKEIESNLYKVTHAMRDMLTTGVTNSVSASQLAGYLYQNICPKLQVHGLVDNERVPGVQWRRSFLNRKGQAFFARIERQKLLKQAQPTVQDTADVASAAAEPYAQEEQTTPPTLAAPKRKPKRKSQRKPPAQLK